MKGTFFQLGITLFALLLSGAVSAQQPIPPRGGEPTPAADFTYEDRGNGTFLFRDASLQGPLEWRWDFGDGHTSAEQHPRYTFAEPGDHTVCLTAANAAGSDTHCETIPVVLLPQPAFSYRHLGHGLFSFQDQSARGATAWRWDFDDGRESTAQNPWHQFPEAGHYNVRLTVFNEAGYSHTNQLIEVTMDAVNQAPGGRELRVFPRVVFDWLDLQLDRTTAEPVHIQFVSPDGKLMREVWIQDEFLINTSGWPKGDYYYHIYDHLGHRIGGGKITVVGEKTT